MLKITYEERKQVKYHHLSMPTKEKQPKQLSARGGKVQCELQGDRVLISGFAVNYMEGTIELS